MPFSHAKALQSCEQSPVTPSSDITSTTSPSTANPKPLDLGENFSFISKSGTKDHFVSPAQSGHRGQAVPSLPQTLIGAQQLGPIVQYQLPPRRRKGCPFPFSDAHCFVWQCLFGCKSAGEKCYILLCVWRVGDQPRPRRKLAERDWEPRNVVRGSCRRGFALARRVTSSPPPHPLPLAPVRSSPCSVPTQLLSSSPPPPPPPPLPLLPLPPQLLKKQAVL